MEQFRGLNQYNDAYYNDRYGHDKNNHFRVNEEDGKSLSQYFQHKASEEADVAKNADDNHWRFISVVVAIPLT